MAQAPQQQTSFRKAEIRRRFNLGSDSLIEPFLSCAYNLRVGTSGEFATFTGAYEDISKLTADMSELQHENHRWFDISGYVNMEKLPELFSWLETEGQSYVIERRFSNDVSVRFTNVDHELAFTIRFA